MGNAMKSEISKKNKYWVEKNRYFELKYFCLQFPIWKKAYNSLDGLEKKGDFTSFTKDGKVSDPTARVALAKDFYKTRMDMITGTIKETDEELSFYILKGVTEGLSYNSLHMMYDIPCCSDTYYDRYRKFFYLLNKVRD